MTDYDPDEAEENRIKGIGKPEPVAGLGEAKERPWRTGTDRAGCSVVLREDGYEIASHIEHRTAELIVEAVNNYDALKQRVKVLEVGFQNVLNVLGPNVPSHLKGCPGCQEEWAEAIRIAEEALAPPVGEKDK